MMTQGEKARAHYKLCREVIDYLWTCADKRIVPLKRDAYLFTSRLERVRHEKVIR